KSLLCLSVEAFNRLSDDPLQRFNPSTISLMPEIQMPKLSDTMTEGTLVAWKKNKGDKVSAGDVIAEIETDKATMEWESAEDGTRAADTAAATRCGSARESITGRATDRGRARCRSCQRERNRSGRPRDRKRRARCCQIEICRGRRVACTKAADTAATTE